MSKRINHQALNSTLAFNSALGSLMLCVAWGGAGCADDAGNSVGAMASEPAATTDAPAASPTLAPPPLGSDAVTPVATTPTLPSVTEPTTPATLPVDPVTTTTPATDPAAGTDVPAATVVIPPVVVGDKTQATVCARWNADRVNLDEGTWSGDIATCDPGDISPDGRANALRLINLYRWLADLEPVVTDPERDSRAQACALLQEANGTLSHTPPMTWTCWTQEGADGSGSSNISTGPGVSSIDAYMIDAGNETTIGHRRWTLSNSLGPIGLGSTGAGMSSCFQNLQGDGDAGKEWMAWPPIGFVPYQAFVPNNRATLDETGWTVQSDSVDLGSAVVSVTSAGVDLPVTVTQLDANFGSRFAIRFNPDGWETTPGQTYAVSITGLDTAIDYQVQVVDCDL